MILGGKENFLNLFKLEVIYVIHIKNIAYI